MKSATTLLSSLCAFAATALALNPIVVQEQEFTDSKTGQRFMIIGIDYQPGGQAAYGTSNSDPLSNPDTCLRDAALMQQLGINTIRSYNVDPTLNHDECASIFAEVGIYMLIDVNSPLAGQSIDRSNPGSSYDSDYLTHIFTVVEAFKSYDNTLGFFAGNEIINTVDTGKNNPPYIRAVQRDLKNYIAKHANRTIPVGYSAAQVEEVLEDSWAYLQCNNSQSGVDMSRSDFFGLNSYSWCGNASSFQISGYDQLVAMFGNSTIPVFFSEYGCNDPLPRYFDEVPVLYGPQMTTLSGGLVYEWTEEGSQYGLVQESGNGTLQLLPDYQTLTSQYAKLNISLIESSNSTATNLQPPACNANLISNDGFSTDFSIPDTPPGGDQLISSGVSSAPTGSMVSVTKTTVDMTVLNTDGAQITGLKITPVANANHPGATSTASAASGSASAKPTKSKSAGAVPRAEVGVLGGAVAAAVFGAGAFVL